MTTLPTEIARQGSHPNNTFPLITTAEPSSWMPLEGLAQTWATFAGTFFTQPAFMAASLAFAALALEAHALQQDSETCRCRFNGDISAARAAGAHTVKDLQAVSAHWEHVLSWLERLAADEREPCSAEEQASIRTLFCETTAQLHRLNALTFQVQEGCLTYYQRTGVLVEEENERAIRHATAAAAVEKREEKER